MCGILGHIDVGQAAPPTWWRRGLDAMVHRGPDSEGIFEDGPVLLGSRRLRIHDLRSVADQPMLSEDRRYVMIFNGAIFNYRDLRSELERRGQVFRTTSDTEVALYAIALWGIEAFVRFDGMFAIAFYDRRSKRVLVARDKLGIKPLHFHRTARRFVFSSEIKPLLGHPDIPRRLNVDVLAEQLAFQQITPPDTLFSGISVLRPGHYIEIEVGNQFSVTDRCYWRIDSNFVSGIRHEDVEGALSASLRQCWASDRPAGIQLSGGVDSSLVTALSVERLGISAPNTFSVFFDDSQIRYYEPRSEERYVRQVCQKYGLKNFNYTFGADEVRPAFAEAVWRHEMPLNGASTCLYMLLARQIQDKVTVLLTGEGADDIFLGYFKDWEFEDDPRSLFKMFVNTEQIQSLFGVAGLQRGLSKRLALSSDSRLQGMTPTQKASVLTIDGILHGLLARHDRMFMAHSIEGRPPFCSDRLVRARFSLTDRDVHGDGEGKLAIKRLAEQFFPRDFVYRRKIGFSAPFGDWCSSTEWWRGYIERIRLPWLADIMDTGVIASGLEQPEGRPKWSGQNLNLLFSIANFQLWYDIFFESRDPLAQDAWRDVVPNPVVQLDTICG